MVNAITAAGSVVLGVLSTASYYFVFGPGGKPTQLSADNPTNQQGNPLFEGPPRMEGELVDDLFIDPMYVPLDVEMDPVEELVEVPTYEIEIVSLDESNWDQVLTGDWLIFA